MKNCIGCKHADWRKTAAGKLHPSGDGKCRYEGKMPPLPAFRYWMGDRAPTPCGGFINRRAEFSDPCALYERAES